MHERDEKKLTQLYIDLAVNYDDDLGFTEESEYHGLRNDEVLGRVQEVLREVFEYCSHK